jgi:hypothetical protein
MLVTSTYPAMLAGHKSGRTALSLTLEAIRDLVPEGSGLHVLPFGPSSGDFGFACDDWGACDPELASWSDIGIAAARYRLIVDGIYNHVGKGHRWVRELADSGAAPEARRRFHTRSAVGTPTASLGPRGWSRYQPCPGSAGRLEIVQTFSEAAFDVDLDDSSVQAEIDRHLSQLAEHGVHGVRLDAPAYYGKDPSGPVRHNPESARLLGAIVPRVEAHGLAPYPQLDVDAQTLMYEPALQNSAAVLTDLAFPAVIYSALDRGDPDLIARHVAEAGERGWTALRGFRTHDGILLRSHSIRPQHLEILGPLARRAGGEFRVIDGDVYELNLSAPRVLRAIFPPDPIRVAKLATALCAFASLNPCVYLPALVGFEPEALEQPDADADPRAQNRVPLSSHFWNSPETRRTRREMRELLEAMSAVAHSWAKVGGGPSMALQGSCFEVSAGSHGLIANLGRTTVMPRAFGVDSILYSSGEVSDGLGPYSFAVVTQ